jgi:predicted RNA polymerase sigma factor
MRGPDAPTRKTIETVWRIEAARLIGGLVRFVRSVDRAEDLAQEALLSALERWPETGIPDNPGAWLMTTAKNRAVDESRRTAMMDTKHRLPSHQIRDDEDEFANVERFRQVSLIAGDKGALSILCPRKRSESQRGNPTAPRFIGAQFPD